MQSLVHNQSIAFPSNGMGINLRYDPSQHVYVTAGFGDANGNPNRTPTDGLASFGKRDYFEAAEVGWSSDLSSVWGGMRRGIYRAPALQPSRDFVAVFGLRSRLVL
jgi:hypothetical protein